MEGSHNLALVTVYQTGSLNVAPRVLDERCEMVLGREPKEDRMPWAED